MKLSVLEIQTITAAEGMVLTNGEAYSEPGATIYLGCNDTPENWWEITAEEAAAAQKAHLPFEE
jgi:hypothetical protein